MTKSKTAATQMTLPSDTEIGFTRTFDAPRELVWQMYTHAEHLVNWWGPKGWTLPVCELDFRVGGTWFYCMQGPPEADNMQSCGKATFQEIIAPEKIVYTDVFTDGEGNPMDGMPEMLITVNFLADSSKTTVSSITRFDSKETRDKVIEMGVEEGLSQSWDRLEAELAKQ